MGSNWIWLIAALGFGIVCGTIYAYYRRKNSRVTLLRWAVWSAIYFAAGWVIYLLMRIIFGS